MELNVPNSSFNFSSNWREAFGMPFMRPILFRSLGTAILISLAAGVLLWGISPAVFAQEAGAPVKEAQADADADEKARFAAFT